MKDYWTGLAILAAGAVAFLAMFYVENRQIPAPETLARNPSSPAEIADRDQGEMERIWLDSFFEDGGDAEWARWSAWLDSQGLWMTAEDEAHVRRGGYMNCWHWLMAQEAK